MRAAIYRETGEARDVLHIENLDPAPEPGAGEVRVRVHVSAVNPTDVKARSGAVPRPIDGFQIPHHDGAGVIDSVGPGVDPQRVGQRVWTWMAAYDKYGTAAEWTVVPQEQAVSLPDEVSLDLGAQLGVPALTAYRCLYADGPLEGKQVLVAGGAGAVGHFAIELAVRAGARVVTTVSNPEKAELAKAAGAHLVVDYTKPDALDALKAFSPRMDRIVEVNIGANLVMDLQLSGPGTTIVCYAAAGADPTLPVRACMTSNAAIRFVLLYGVPRETLVEGCGVITEALHAKALTSLPLHRFPLDDTVGAHEAQEANVTGKVLVDIQ